MTIHILPRFILGTKYMSGYSISILQKKYNGGNKKEDIMVQPKKGESQLFFTPHNVMCKKYKMFFFG